MWASAHWPIAARGPCRVRPRPVSSYSTRGGTSAKTCRVTRPSRSRSRRVSVRTLPLMPSTAFFPPALKTARMSSGMFSRTSLTLKKAMALKGFSPLRSRMRDMREKRRASALLSALAAMGGC